jgi:phage baseplate assembly protein W
MAQFSADRYTTTDDKPKDLYSDFRNDFRIHPGKQDLLRVTDENSVKQSIINLLKTDHFERPYQPYLGANLRTLLFELSTEDLVVRAESIISKCITTYEPRARLISVNVTSTPDEHALYVQVVFATKTTTTPITLDVILNRVR